MAADVSYHSQRIAIALLKERDKHTGKVTRVAHDDLRIELALRRSRRPVRDREHTVPVAFN